MEWVDSNQLAIQHLNRRQNQWKMYLVAAGSGDSNAVLEDEDAAWIDVHDETLWLKDKSGFLWLSEKSGWRHIYMVSRDGQTVVPVTHGKFDVMEVLGIDENEQLVYFDASPDNATQKYLYRVNLDGSGLMRVTPTNQIGTHRYVLSPDRKRALVTVSRFAEPPRTDVVRLTDHSVEFVVDANDLVKRKVAAPRT